MSQDSLAVIRLKLHEALKKNEELRSEKYKILKSVKSAQEFCDQNRAFSAKEVLDKILEKK